MLKSTVMTTVEAAEVFSEGRYHEYWMGRNSFTKKLTPDKGAKIFELLAPDGEHLAPGQSTNLRSEISPPALRECQVVAKFPLV